MAQLVEHHLAKVRVAGSSPVVRSTKFLVTGRKSARCSMALISRSTKLVYYPACEERVYCPRPERS